MPKKPPRNAYFYFMQDYKEREENMGRRFPNGMRDVAELASDEWKLLSAEEKEYYTQLAKQHKHDPRPEVALEKKFNSHGKSFLQLEREKQEKERKFSEQIEFVKKYVNDLDIDELKVHNFYLIHVNYYLKTDHNEFYPAELAISEFSLLNGVQKVFHRFLHPGNIPPGYAADMKMHAEQYHKITQENVIGENDLRKVYNEVRDFLSPKFGRKNLPPLFTMHDNIFDNTSINAVKKTLKRLWESGNSFGGEDWEKEFRVFSLSRFLYEFKKRCVLHSSVPNASSFPNDVLAEEELRKDTFHYHIAMACKFHQEEDVIMFCSQSYVNRWTHIIRDHCCRFLNIEYEQPSSHNNDEVSTSSNYHSLKTTAESSNDYDDSRSVSSKVSNFTYYSESSVDFQSAKAESCVNSSPPSSVLENSWASAVSQVNKAPSMKSWASASQPKVAPTFNNENFPSLGGERRPIPTIGRGRGMVLADKMQKLTLKK